MAANSLTTRLVKTHVLTAGYRIQGTAQVTNTGLCGSLNDPTTSSIVIINAVMGRILEPDVITNRFEALRVQKRHIINACLERRKDVGPRSKRAGYQQTNEYTVDITDISYFYEGVYEWSGRFDFSSMMSEGGDFFPIFQGTIQSIANPDFTLNSPAIVINRRHLATFAHALKNRV